jgi:PAS domain S-box-containing protein
MTSFGRSTLSYDPLELRDGRRIVNLPSKQLEVLALLVRARGEIVERERFLDEIWDGSFVEEANLTQTIFLLRRTLGKLASGGMLIETIPRIGYRLAPEAFQGDATDGSRPRSHGVEIREEDSIKLLVQSFEDYAIYMLDPAGLVATWNPGAEKSKGYTAQEIIGQHFSIFFVPEDIAARVPDRELAAAARTGRSSGEGWRIRKNGERFWASYAITAVRNASGQLIGFGKVVRDLSERKKQEDALFRLEAIVRRERDRMRAAAESSMDALFVCDAVRDGHGEIQDFIFTYLNKNVEKLVAIPLDDLLSSTMCQLLPLNKTHGYFEEYKRVVNTGVPFTAELSLNDELIHSHWLRVRAVKLADGVVITASDITELKQMQERLRRYENGQEKVERDAWVSSQSKVR